MPIRFTCLLTLLSLSFHLAWSDQEDDFFASIFNDASKHLTTQENNSAFIEEKSNQDEQRLLDALEALSQNKKFSEIEFFDPKLNEGFGIVAKKWQTQLSGANWSRFSQKIAFKNGYIYVASDNLVNVVEQKTGKIVNTFSINLESQIEALKEIDKKWIDFDLTPFENRNLNIVAGPVLIGNKIILGDQSGLVISIDQLDGAIDWVYDLKEPIDLLNFLKESNLIFIQTLSDKIFILEPQTGKLNWQYQDPKKYSHLKFFSKSTPLFLNKQLIVGLKSGNIVALDIANQSADWYLTVNSNQLEPNQIVDIGMPILYNQSKNIFYVLAHNDQLKAYQFSDDKSAEPRKIWESLKSSHLYYGLKYLSDRLIVFDSNQKLSIYNASNGEMICSKSLKNFKFSHLTLMQNQLLLNNEFGDLHWFSIQNCQQFASYPIEKEGVFIQPVVKDDILYLLEKTGKLFAITIIKNEQEQVK